MSVTPARRIATVLLGCGICLPILLAPVVPDAAPRLPAPFGNGPAGETRWVLKLALIILPSLATALLTLEGYRKTGTASLLGLGLGIAVMAGIHGAAIWPDPAGVLTERGAALCSLALFLAALGLFFGATPLLSRPPRVDRRRLPATVMLPAALGAGLLFLYGIQPSGPGPFMPELPGPALFSSAVVLFWMAGILFFRMHRHAGSGFLFWQTWGLIYLAAGMGDLFPARYAPLFPSPAGQTSQFLAGALFWAALLSIMVEAFRSRRPPAGILADRLADPAPHYRELVESLNDAVISCDANGRVLLWNSAAEAMFGHTAPQMAGLTIDRLLGCQALHLCPPKAASSGAAGKPSFAPGRVELTARPGPGRTLPLEISVAHSRTSRGWITTLVMRDVTERETAARALEQLLLKNREQKEFFEKLMAILPIGIAVVAGQEHRYEYANPYYRAIPAGSGESMIGKTIQAVFPHDNMQKAIDTIATVYRSSEVVSVRECRVRLGPGRENTFWNTDFVPLIGGAGETEAVMIITQEITAEKRAKDALKKSHRELEQRVMERTAELLVANQALQEEIDQRRKTAETLKFYTEKLEWSNRELQDFAFVASHDLQEPLRKIQAFGDRLRSRYAEALDATGRDYLARMQNAAARMQLLIEDLLEYSRITTRGKPFVPTDLNALIQQVLTDLEIRLEQTGGRVETGALTVIEADPPQIQRLFQNLIANALKFRRDEPPRIRIQGRPIPPPAGRDQDAQAAWYQVRVSDNGIGFDEKYLDRIFVPFQRLHGRAEFEGTGMGLAICRKIVRRHGGEIYAQSAPGQGATFIIDLPLCQPVNPPLPLHAGEGLT